MSSNFHFNEEYVAPKPYSCFICNKNSYERGLPLLRSETTHSRIVLGEKLQEILGDKLVVLLNQKDAVCWKCATHINKFDKFEHELDLIKDYVVSSLLEKYNCKPEDVNRFIEEKGVESNNSLALDFDDSSLHQEIPPRQIKPKQSGLLKTSNKIKPDRPHKVRFDPQVKVKTSEALGIPRVKEEQLSPPIEEDQQFQCDVCLHTFEKYDIFEKHVKLHNLAKSRFYKCKLCEFSSSNLETYCRHICNFNTGKYISCSQCKRNFISSTNQNENPLCHQCVIMKNKINNPSAPKLKETPGKLSIPTTEKQVGLKSGATDKRSQESLRPEAKPKPHLVRKLTTEGSIEYEEDPGEEGDHSIDPESADSESVSEQQKVVYMYQDGEGKTPQNIKVEQEDEDERVREIIVPDQVLAQITKGGKNSPYMLKCSNCEEVLDVRQLPTHRCFLELEAVEFFEVENALEIDMSLSKKDQADDARQYGYVDQDGYYHSDGQIVGLVEQENDDNYQPRLLCKTCFLQFPTIVQLREHWQDSGHAWEVGTVNVDVKTIKDKVLNNEQTFKVVKQLFSMKANLPMQNNVIESDYNDEHIFNIKNMFVKVKAKNECETCGKLFPHEEMLKDHMVEECLSCTFCGIKFLSNSLLKKHYQCTGHWRKIVKDDDPSTRVATNTLPVCPICQNEFFSRYKLGIHLKTHYKGTNAGACHYCFKQFDEKHKIYQHVSEVHNAQIYKCRYCDKLFLSEMMKRKHQVLKHKNVSVECHLCNIKFRSLKMLLKHNDEYHREKACRICGKHITSWQRLRRHEKRHFYEKGLNCSLCKRTFRNSTALKVHNASQHKGEFKFYCEKCEGGFMTVEALVEHRKIHLKSRNICSKCGKKCYSKTALWVHKKVHDGPYSCLTCSRVFRDTSLLAIHRRKHARAKPYQCPHCPKMFSVSATLKRHLTKHNIVYPFRCALCRRGFISRYSYHRHLVVVHNVVNQCDPSSSTLPLNATDEDIFQAADTLISDDNLIINGYSQEDSSNLIREVVVETTELFEEILS